MELFKKLADIESAIDLIKTSGKALDDLIHKALCSATVHRDKHGDNTLLARIIDAMPKGSRANAAIQWCEKYAGVKYAGRSKAKLVQFSNEGEANLLEGMQEAFYDLKGKKEGEEYQHDAELKSILLALERRITKAADAGDQILVHALKRAVQAIQDDVTEKEPIKKAIRRVAKKKAA